MSQRPWYVLLSHEQQNAMSPSTATAPWITKRNALTGVYFFTPAIDCEYRTQLRQELQLHHSPEASIAQLACNQLLLYSSVS